MPHPSVPITTLFMQVAKAHEMVVQCSELRCSFIPGFASLMQFAETVWMVTSGGEADPVTGYFKRAHSGNHG